MTANRAEKTADIIIIGAGIVGLSFALAMAKQQPTLQIVVIESSASGSASGLEEVLTSGAAQASLLSGRVLAINHASQHYLAALGVWDNIRAQSLCAYTAMRVWDGVTGSEIGFDCREIGESNLGYIVPQQLIRTALWDALKECETVTLACPEVPQTLVGATYQCSEAKTGAAAGVADSICVLTDKNGWRASLLVGADGADSWVKTAAGIETSEKPYGHVAITAVIETEKSHQCTAWQRFMPTGPLALLPLSNPHQCSIVWSTTPEEAAILLQLETAAFSAKVTAASEYCLGELRCVSAPRSFPLMRRHAGQYVAPRIALLGDALHTVHPLAGQGLNLGLADAAGLAKSLADGLSAGRRLGAWRDLRQFERARKSEVVLMLAAMDGFKKIFAARSPTLITLRDVGLRQVAQSQWVKQWLIRQALGCTERR